MKMVKMMTKEMPGPMLHLGDDQIKALGLEGTEYGTQVMLQAVAIVSMKGEMTDETGEKYNMCLQVAEMGLESKKPEKRGMDMGEAAKTIYKTNTKADGGMNG